MPSHLKTARGKRRPAVPKDAFLVPDPPSRPRLRDPSQIHQAATDAFYLAVGACCPRLNGKPIPIETANQEPDNSGTGWGIDTLEFSDSRSAESMDFGFFYPHGLYATLHSAPPERREALERLFVEFAAALDKAHAAGVGHGRNLLLGLASGDLTTAQLNSNATQATPKPRLRAFAALLARHGVVQQDAVDDAENYDSGTTMAAIAAVHEEMLRA